MAQYGAYGFAQKGWKYERILAHYYRGTELGPAPVSTIRVLLASGATPRDRLRRLVPSPGRVRVRSTGCRRERVELGTVLDLPASERTACARPARALPAGSAPLELGKPYRGSLVVSLADGKLQAVNRVALERYL